MQELIVAVLGTASTGGCLFTSACACAHQCVFLARTVLSSWRRGLSNAREGRVDRVSLLTASVVGLSCVQSAGWGVGAGVIVFADCCSGCAVL